MHVPIALEPATAPRLPIQPANRRYCVVLLFPGHMLTDHLAYGDGLVAYGFISALARRGHRLHVIAQRVAFKDPLPANVTVHSAGAATGEGIGERLAFVARSRAIVRRLMRMEHIDLVHQLNPVCNGMSLGLLGVPVPVILGTFVAKWPAEPAPRASAVARLRTMVAEFARVAVLRLQEHRAAAFLVTTPAALSRLISTDSLADRVHWLPHGIDMTAFAPLPPGADARSTILFLASVAVKKGIFTLLDAFTLVREKIPNAKLVIAGHGTAFEQMQRSVAAHAHAAHIDVLGPVDRSAVPQLMADCAVYCLPSFGEPYATTVIEAMACAKPVVVTASGGLRDMVDDRGGRRVEPGDSAELAQALVEILSFHELAAQMGVHNRAVVAAQYDWPRVTVKLESVYEWVVMRRATHGA